MTRSGRLKLALAAMVSVCLVLGCEYETVYFSFGQHVDFYHSYRGDSPDEDGFGKDIRVITETLDFLDELPHGEDELGVRQLADPGTPASRVRARSCSIESRPGSPRRTKFDS